MEMSSAASAAQQTAPCSIQDWSQSTHTEHLLVGFSFAILHEVRAAVDRQACWDRNQVGHRRGRIPCYISFVANSIKHHASS